jgi:hypothetical protein
MDNLLKDHRCPISTGAPQPGDVGQTNPKESLQLFYLSCNNNRGCPILPGSGRVGITNAKESLPLPFFPPFLKGTRFCFLFAILGKAKDLLFSSKGTGFSPYVIEQRDGALAPEGMSKLL